MDEEVVIIMDSGGGSMSHFATEVGVLSAKYRCRPFYLAPYHTAALMPLDQAPNREFERAWSECRSKQSNFSTLQALDACHECWDKAYSSQNVLKGFASVGMTLGKPLCREKVLLERGPHLFRKTVPKQERNYVSDCADKVLSPPKGYKRAPDSVRCSSAKCRGLVQPGHQFCPTCGAKNESFDPIAQAVDAGARQQGYRRKATALVDLQDALDFEPAGKKHLVKVWGDMLSKMRAPSKDESAPTTPAPTPPTPAPTTPAPQVVPATPALQTKGPQAAPSTAPAATAKAPEAQGKQAEAEENCEFDLDNPEDVCNYILGHFKASLREGAMPAVKFYVGQLKAKCTKAKPLSSLVQHEIVSSRVLMKPHTRDMWLKSWVSNRSHRYVSLPKK